MELMQANAQWSSRPDDERFVDLDELFEHCADVMENSRAVDVSTRSVRFEPTDSKTGLVVCGPNSQYAPTHWAFDQMCQRVGAPAGYLRDHLPSPMVADVLNYEYQVRAPIDDVQMLLYQNGGQPEIHAATGTGYGRIWNANISRTLRDIFGNGLDGRFHVPYEFNRKASVTKQSTTLYAGDRDMWVFLADGKNDIEIKSRRNGENGHAQRGFFCWNSDVGSKSFGVGSFIFDYMCGNHIIWSASNFNEIRIRHTASAPDRWAEEIVPALQLIANSDPDQDTHNINEAIKRAQQQRLGDKTDEFLATRFGPRMVAGLKAVHEAEEHRPIETVWDVVTAATAKAKAMPWIGIRADLEREAGKLLVAA